MTVREKRMRRWAYTTWLWRRKKLDDASKDVVEKDSKKEMEFGKKKESVVSCVFVQPCIFFSIPSDIQTLFIQDGRR